MSSRLLIFKLIKILFLNILIFTLVFIFFELTVRSIWSIKHFKNPHVSYWGKTWYPSKEDTFLSFDPVLGSLPIPGFYNENINIPRWPKNTKVSINNLGFRDNDNKNLELSNKRVNQVMKYLIDKGIDKKRIGGKGYGSERPLVNKNSLESRKMNRRVEIIFKKINN